MKETKLLLGFTNFVEAKNINRKYVKIVDIEKIKADLEITAIQNDLFSWLDSRCRWWPYYFVNKKQPKLQEKIKDMVYGNTEQKIAERNDFYDIADDSPRINSIPNDLNDTQWHKIFTNKEKALCKSSHWIAKFLTRKEDYANRHFTRIELLEEIIKSKRPEAPEILKKAAVRSMLLELLFGYTINGYDKITQGLNEDYRERIKEILKKKSAEKYIPTEYQFTIKKEYKEPRYARLVIQNKNERKRVLSGFKIYNFYKLYWETPAFKKRLRENK